MLYYFKELLISTNTNITKWARMDSNHRTPKRTDLQSVAVGHLATYPTLCLEPMEGFEPPTR